MKHGCLSISEAFNSLQGEGRNIGMPCTFLRLAYCNLACVFCDTKYSWDWKHYDPKTEITDLSIPDVAKLIMQWGAHSLVITGGEPLLQQAQLVELYDYMERTAKATQKHTPFTHIEIETAGTIRPTDALVARVNLFNVSPKLENSGNKLVHRFKELALQQFADLAAYNKAVFKFVVTSAEDYVEIDAMVDHFQIPEFAVYIMPEGITESALKTHLQAVAQGAIDRHYNVTTRLHVLLYGNKRGV